MVGDITVGKILLCVILIGSAGNILIWLFKVLHRKCYNYSLINSVKATQLHATLSVIDIIRCLTVGVFVTVLLISNRKGSWVTGLCPQMGIIALLSMCSPGYVHLALLLEDCNVSNLFNGNAIKQRCLSFTIIVFGLLFTLSTGVMPYMVGGGYTYVNHSVSCQPDDGSSDHRAVTVYHFFGGVLIYWIVILVSLAFLCKHINRVGGIGFLLKPSTSGLLVASYLLCFFPESASETFAALRIFRVIYVPAFLEDSETYENYGHVVMAVILPVLSSAVNCIIHFRDIIRYPTVIEYELAPGELDPREVQAADSRRVIS